MMAPSKTSADVGGHWSLGLPAYAKATSPIRRYTDVLVHRQLKALGSGEPLPFARDDLEAVLAPLLERERAVNRMQSMSERYWTLVHLGASGCVRPGRAPWAPRLIGAARAWRARAWGSTAAGRRRAARDPPSKLYDALVLNSVPDAHGLVAVLLLSVALRARARPMGAVTVRGAVRDGVRWSVTDRLSCGQPRGRCPCARAAK